MRSGLSVQRLFKHDELFLSCQPRCGCGSSIFAEVSSAAAMALGVAVPSGRFRAYSQVAIAVMTRRGRQEEQPGEVALVASLSSPTA